MMPDAKRKRYSAAGIGVLLLGLLIVIVTAGVYYMQLRQREALIERAAMDASDTLDMYIRHMENAFDSTEKSLYSLVYQNPDIEALSRSEDEVTRFRARRSILERLEQMVQMNDLIQSVWVYSPAGDEREFLARNGYTGVKYRELCEIQDALVSNLQDTTCQMMQSNLWPQVVIDGRTYLTWIMPVGETFCGAWVSTDKLLQAFDKLQPLNAGSRLILCDQAQHAEGDSSQMRGASGEDGRLWSLEDGNLKISRKSKKSEISFCIIMSEQSALGNVNMDFDYAWFAAGLSVFVLVVFLVCQIMFYRPFRRLISEIESIGKCEQKEQIDGEFGFKEVHKIAGSINTLLQEIHALKISVYESQLQKRNTECQYLQIRLKSHFYLNCLSIIHAMARIKNTELIEELTLCLSEYLRFVEKDSRRFVPLKSELDHIRNYARIQELRFPNVFEYFEDVSAELYDASIPPLVLQTFIENAVEHAFMYEKQNWIRLKARMEERGELLGICFEITDNGNGFPQEELDALNLNRPAFDSTKSHGIGIRNVISRLQIMYEEKAEIVFKNRTEGGAVILMWLPLVNEEEG